MVATELNRLPSFKNRRALSPPEMTRGNGRAIQSRTSRAIESHLQTVGWISRQKIYRLPAEGEVFLLTSLFIEPAISKWNKMLSGQNDTGQLCGCLSSRIISLTNPGLAMGELDL
jgi:hypothetical protein